MKKVFFVMMCLAVMIAASPSIKAQEVTITLSPGWNWISCPLMDTLDFETALGSFTPMVGDAIKSQWGNAVYKANGHWRGRVSQFYPGHCYRYYSKRNVPVTVTFYAQQPAQQVIVTTAEPNNITTMGAVVGGIVTINECNHIFARGVCWGTEPNPDIDGSHQAGDNVAGSQSFTLYGLIPGTTYYARAYVVTDYGLAYGNQQNFTTESSGSGGNYDYVDLGLPSGLLWATCNVGADVPEEYGDYFAWAETNPKSMYDRNTYQYIYEYKLIKYCSNFIYGYNGYTDTLTTLLPEDDAATTNWGGNWRMPTQAEWQELYDNCTSVWTTQLGVYGRRYTGTNGNTLFLPAAGCRWLDELYAAGDEGYYWSSSLVTSNPVNAWKFNFTSYNPNVYGGILRYEGGSVRAVRSGQN